jgi:fido (protein-threonine AMPylation protein)
MVSKYDIFYFIATNESTIGAIAKGLHRQEDYANIRKKVLELEREGYIKNNKTITIFPNDKTKQLYRLLVFCIKNNISYNFLFRKPMLDFIKKAAKKEFFTMKDMNINHLTFNLYTTALERYGFLLIVSRKPFVCKLLRHHFLVDLLHFFKMKVNFYAPKQYSLIPKIKKELKTFTTLQKIHGNLFIDVEKKNELNFIHTSLSLEGNPITISDTEKIILNKVVPQKYQVEHIQAVANYKKAVDAMIEDAKEKKALTLPVILDYHRQAMWHIKGAGEVRKQNVRIKGNPHFKTCEWRLLPNKLAELLKKYKTFEAKKQYVQAVIEFAAFFHNEFQRIHPFIDGNSRLSRLLLLYIIRSHDLPVLDLPLGYFDEYLDLTKRSTKRNDAAFQYLVEEVVFFNVRSMNWRMKR